MAKPGLKTEEAKITSHLMKDIARISKTADKQTRMNILRKHQIKLFNQLIERLLKEGKITREELKEYMPRKKQTENILFGNQKNKGHSTLKGGVCKALCF